MPESPSRHVDALLAFIREQGELGTVPTATAHSRYASVRKVLSVLDSEEATDVTSLDVDDVMQRFLKESDHNYSIASKISYRSRLQSSIEEFCAFINGDPPRNSRGGRARISASELVVREAKSATQGFTFGLRTGVLVRVEGLPLDLTTDEAQRLSNVLMAYASKDSGS